MQLTRVGVCEQGAHGQENLADCQSWAPLILENIQAYLAIAVDVAMINASPENYLHQACHALHQEYDPFTFTAHHASLGSQQCSYQQLQASPTLQLPCITQNAAHACTQLPHIHFT